MLLTILSIQRNYNRRGQPWYEDTLDVISQLPWLYILPGLVILFLIFKRTRKEYHSHWNTLVPNFKYSTKDFYKHLTDEIKGHGINRIKTSHVNLKKGGFVSASRLYLRVEWKRYQYDMCCAPFGDGLFLSSWLLYKTSFGEILISRIPFVGGWLSRKFYKITYYKIDAASMFMTYCHNAMLKVADEITKESGARINGTDRKPLLKDIFKR